MNTVTTHSWLLMPAPPHNDRAVPSAVAYHRILAGEKRRIGRGILAVVLLLAGFVIFPTAVGRALAPIDQRMGDTPPIIGGDDYTPLFHAGSMISLALLIPWSMLIQRWLYGVPCASLHSVTSRFRFDLFGKALLVFGPLWAVVNLIGLLAPSTEVAWSRSDLIGMFVATLLLTPLQTTGEEYGVRGLIFRVIGSWTRSSRAGVVAGVLVSSVLFTAVHGSTDLYINVWYFVLWTCLAIITWRTGGLEIAIILHAILNTDALLGASLLRVDLGAQLSDRSSGVGSPTLLLPALAVIVITAITWWCTRKTGPVLSPPSSSGARREPFLIR
ncbi:MULTISPECIES: CPBP family intramembrane glutamic endopeptidase [Streptomyces]|uniref:CPBP family intramembrane glutamic endopeptidase n=2 Tax=Streptomyces TaxID=1883 RepID=UPI0004BE43C4|nr:type II CAAX endopeptidase family protein [Streptomyces sp. SL203]MCY1649508.1 type II CAAX endopeptidase family protein [Streptomyces sp. SL203]RAS23526.1 membrane protease YdiL (CAAX protease family) [Streptomyces avidinii]SNX80914.1 Membrane protease YdiL, CAAX protease family [Streptomyces microflavus]